MSKRPLLHVSPKRGWINDPNGFSYAFGKFYLFAQHNPYDTKWGPMHWIQFESTDLVVFNEKGIALQPSEKYDHEFGCFSGSALTFNHKHILLYTGVADEKQTQCLAISTDGKKYIKSKLNPVISENDLPNDHLIKDFRDPFVFKKEDVYYVLISARKENNGSSILMYKTLDFKTFTYVGVSLSITGEQEMIECPAVFFDNDKTVLIYSHQFKVPENKYEYQNVHSTMYVVGNFDYETGAFKSESSAREIDNGFDFYAPQTLTAKGKHYLVAWQNMWDRDYPSRTEGYAGNLTLVRELSLKHNRLYQKFVPNLSNYYTKTQIINDAEYEVFSVPVDKKYAHRYRLEFNRVNEAILYFTNDEKVSIVINATAKTLTFNRPDIQNTDGSSTKVRTIKLEENDDKLSLDIVFDKSAMDVLINNGKYSFSMLFYTNASPCLTIKSLTNEKFKIKNLTYNQIAPKEVAKK
ncbi:MAG: Sucrose-6-phosphate hydrolase [Tenericutes bacterium ADurb.Bin087]|nr:MAG: Sucrose-6-phosphate hydrolase [Tenericutes bacterium ADurb.Bin087]